MMKTPDFTSRALALCLLASPPAFAQTPPDGTGAEASGTHSRTQLTLDDLRTFTDVFNQVRRNYVEPVDDKTLLDAAIRGMLSELDPHSAYLGNDEYRDLNDTSRGRYSGIGVNVRPEDGFITVDAIINGSPADQAGINPGDVITSINGNPVRGRYLPDAIDEIDGEPGTGLTMEVLTPEGDTREVVLQREYIQYPTLSYELLEQSWGYFRLSQFHRESAVHLREALESITAEGTLLRGLIIDLRNNPGGVLQPAVAIADGFLDGGLIVFTRGRNQTMQMEFTAQPGQWLEDIPLVLLVDRGTASASEVLAGALQDHGRALLIGEQTFGKGSVQSVLPLRNGAGIKLTTARYYSPSGRSIQAMGVTPDIIIDEASRDDADGRGRESDLAGHLAADRQPAGRAPGASGIAKDFPLDEILQVLENAELFGPSRPQEPSES
jgi:carboxyl-terminal processing protease